jgi:hypothetical protein
MEHEIIIDGMQIIGLHDDNFLEAMVDEMAGALKLQVNRATNVEPHEGNKFGWVVLTPSGDPWSCSLCLGAGSKKQPCGCCYEEYCSRCEGLGYEVFQTRNKALAHEKRVLNAKLGKCHDQGCDFDPFELV